ncbi:MAG TPA: ABC transporter ATP-binding protein [Bacillales bacterium]|nr:ABC transporter ATP-binding protein [Bacillales bacterium]
MSIILKDVTKSYGPVEHPIYALNHVNLGIRRGEWVSILGPSGSGKTTLLNCVGGMDRPDEGTIENSGQGLSALSAKEMQVYRRKTIGYIFQDFRLLDQYTVLDNVMLPQIPYKPLEEVKEKAVSVLEEFEMDHRMKHLPGQLSGGEKQRTAIARALLNEPTLLLCDEPTGNLDKENRDRILGVLKRLQGDGRTILLVTHDPEVAEVGDRECFLRDGVLEEIVHT